MIANDRKRGAVAVAEKSILLISCYELGHQPLGIASPLAFLKQAGFRAQGLDISVESLDEEKVRDAWFVGISVPMHTALRLGLRAAERVRSLNPDGHVCFYGLYAWLNAEHLLQGWADSVIGGEYERPLVALVESLAKERPGPVPGVSRKGQLVGPFLARLRFPVADRRGLPSLEKYARLEQEGSLGLVGSVEASRGCLHRCLHCPIPPVYGGRFFVVPRETVLEDIRQLARSGASHISFGDPDFLNGPRHSLAIARAMHEEFPDLTFDFTAKIEHILKHRALFSGLRELGCLFVTSAVESLSDRVLAELEKGHSRAGVYEALSILRRAGIDLRPSLVSFTPWTGLEDYLDVLDWVEQESLLDQVDPVQYTIRLLIPPGSALLSRPGIQPFLGPLAPDSLTYLWTHPDRRMDLLHLQVSELVEAAAGKEEDPALTFEKVREIAWEVAGRRPPGPARERPAPERRRPPRLTEPWFC